MPRVFDVWVEGYATNGERSTAQLLGSVLADNWKDACQIVCDSCDLPLDDDLKVWGCQLFENEQDARRNFG
jgi:hypothetical protein